MMGQAMLFVRTRISKFAFSSHVSVNQQSKRPPPNPPPLLTASHKAN